MEYILDLLQLAGLGYLAWRQRAPKAAAPPQPISPELREIVRQAITQRVQQGTSLGSGRERLRARLERKMAEKVPS